MPPLGPTPVSAPAPVKEIVREPKPVQSADSYYQSGAAQLNTALKHQSITGRAKNIILMVGDGMGMSTVTAGRIFTGQANDVDGESYILNMEKFPHTALSRTYAHDAQVSDSASTITALTSGAKVNRGTIGVDQSVAFGDCAASKGHNLTSLFELAETAGRATGVVTTARITHATPAGVYGHAASRGWERDTRLDEEAQAQGCVDLARQLIEWPYGDGLEVAFGGGRENFLPDTEIDPEYDDQWGKRGDGRNLVDEWAQKAGHEWVWNGEQFAAIDFSTPTKVLGLFEPSHMKDSTEHRAGAGEPTLAALTKAAITRLSQNDDGYVLLIEGAKIDLANHDNNAKRALQEVMAFDQAVAVARAMTDRADTLIIVTADHSHGLTINGYPKRNNPITGFANEGGFARDNAADGKTHSTLLYSSGPGTFLATEEQLVQDNEGEAVDYSANETMALSRPDPSAIDPQSPEFRNQSLIPTRFSFHTGEDVPVFADGPSAHLVRGAIEENTLFHIMAYAAGLAGYAPEE